MTLSLQRSSDWRSTAKKLKIDYVTFGPPVGGRKNIAERTFLTNHSGSSGRRYGRRVLESIGQSISVQKREGELQVIDREESHLQLLVHFL